MGSREPEAASAVLAGFCRAGERSGVELVAKVPVHGCRFYVVVGRMQCASARALASGLFVAGRAATWLGAVQSECAAFEATARAVVRGVEFRVTVRRFYYGI